MVSPFVSTGDNDFDFWPLYLLLPSSISTCPRYVTATIFLLKLHATDIKWLEACSCGVTCTGISFEGTVRESAVTLAVTSARSCISDEGLISFILSVSGSPTLGAHRRWFPFRLFAFASASQLVGLQTLYIF